MTSFVFMKSTIAFDMYNMYRMYDHCTGLAEELTIERQSGSCPTTTVDECARGCARKLSRTDSVHVEEEEQRE